MIEVEQTGPSVYGRTRTGRSSFQTIADMTHNIVLKSISANGSYIFLQDIDDPLLAHAFSFFLSFFPFGFLNENQIQPSHIDNCLKFRQIHEFIAA